MLGFGGQEWRKYHLTPAPKPEQLIKHYCEIFDPLKLATSHKAAQSGMQTPLSRLPSPLLPLKHFLLKRSMWE